MTRLATGASTTCRVADRGPFVSGMIIDLSKSAFAEIASIDVGIVQVRLSW
ncbi:MAG: septal ring lytic transglycosylase RlpA family protein [Actinomycetota bacterium]|nr:septal ring lytic transglycosylase RlpA family protein [Actinomycetota bacterium]